MPICCFARHSDYYPSERDIKYLYNLIENLIVEKNVTEFWVGNYGSFDGTASKIVSDIKAKHSDVKLCLVVPYLTKKITEYKILYKKYDEIIMADIPENTPHKFRIIKCNEYMINKSDFLIAYVTHNWGGAAKTLNYALKKQTAKKIKVFNIGAENQ